MRVLLAACAGANFSAQSTPGTLEAYFGINPLGCSYLLAARERPWPRSADDLEAVLWDVGSLPD